MQNAPNAKPGSWESMTLKEKMDVTQVLALGPALTLMVFRRKVGFRIVKPGWLIVMGAALAGVAALSFHGLGGDNATGGLVTLLFAAVFLVVGFWHRYTRFSALCRGERLHTYSRGISVFEPMPEFMHRHRRIYRILEPLSWWVFGAGLYLVGHWLLGCWITFAAMCLAIHETAYYERLLNADLDILDSLIAAEVHQETVAIFSPDAKPAEQHQRSLVETAGIPTGVSDDIKAQIARRQARKQAPDNLAVSSVVAAQVAELVTSPEPNHHAPPETGEDVSAAYYGLYQP